MSDRIRTSAPVAVVVRLWPNTQRLVALLPELPGDELGRDCLAVEQTPTAVEYVEVHYDFDTVIERTLEPETRGELYGAKRLVAEVQDRFGDAAYATRYATDQMHRERRRTATVKRHERNATYRTTMRQAA